MLNGRVIARLVCRRLNRTDGFCHLWQHAPLSPEGMVLGFLPRKPIEAKEGRFPLISIRTYYGGVKTNPLSYAADDRCIGVV